MTRSEENNRYNRVLGFFFLIIKHSTIKTCCKNTTLESNYFERYNFVSWPPNGERIIRFLRVFENPTVLIYTRLALYLFRLYKICRRNEIIAW